MPDISSPNIQVRTPKGDHQDAADAITNNLNEALGVHHQVLPTTSDTDVSTDQDLISKVGEGIDRAVIGKLGHEPAKNWLKKLFKRKKEQNPGADLRLGDK